MIQICILLASHDLRGLDYSDPAACARNVLSIRIRFRGPFRKKSWIAELVDDACKVSDALASGKAVGILTNIEALEREFINQGAAPISPPDSDFVLRLTRAAFECFNYSAAADAHETSSHSQSDAPSGGPGWPVDPVGILSTEGNGCPHTPGALLPVSHVLEEINQRLRKLSIGLSLETLRQHVRQMYFPDDRKQVTASWYFQTYLANQFTGRLPPASGHRDFLSNGLRVLELAVLACERARSDPKRLRTLLKEAVDYCKQFDMLQRLRENERLASAAARVRGGKARQANLEPARRRAARLLLAKAPQGGWESPAHAARTIEPHVSAFVARRHLSMWGNRRTIVRWINHHPIVRSAYVKRRRPPAP